MAWERLAHTELGSNGTLASGTFSAKKNLRVIIYGNAVSGGTIALNFNSDTGNNYPYRVSDNGGSDGTAAGQPAIPMTITSNVKSYCVIDITNLSDKEKICIGHSTDVGSGAGAGNAPTRREVVGKWVNTSAQITSIQIVNNSAASLDLAAGSYITVLGAKEAATSDVITVDSLEAKKHLMVQGNLLNSGELNTVALQFNSDTGNNYSRRYSINGGTEATDTSQPSLEIEQGSAWSGDCFFTAQIINEAAKEKLVQSEWIDQQSTGAGSAPRRAEVVGKWSNTSNAITTIKVIQAGSGSFAEGSEVTVYGTD